MFLHNYWYDVAWNGEVEHTPFARTVCGEPIVLYRHTRGALAAFEDCCHRLLPLYHGAGNRNDNLVSLGLGAQFSDRGSHPYRPHPQGPESSLCRGHRDVDAQQRNILLRKDRELLNLKIDAGVVQARRPVERELGRSQALSLCGGISLLL